MSSDAWDYVIVGAGSAGCVIAARLTQDPTCRVLVLEAGGSDRTPICRIPGMVSVIHTVPQIKKRFDWGFATVPQTAADDRRMACTRGRVLGGSSAINGMVFVRGNPADYDGWAADGCPGWSWADTLPAFRRLEDWEGGASETRGAGGPIAVSRPRGITPASEAFLPAVAGTCGLPILDDYNGGQQLGASLFQLSSRDGLRYSASEAYLHPAMSRPNLEVRTGCHVHRVLFEGQRATGIRYARQGGLHDAMATTEVILCGGAIGTPQLLLLSGVGPATHLRALGLPVLADLPVGENLQDHCFFPLTFHAPRAEHRGTARHFFGGMFTEFLRGGTWFGRSVFECVAFLRAAGGQGAPDLQLHSLPWAYPPNQDDTSRRPEVDARPCFTIQPTLLHPASRGTVRLRSADPADGPAIDPAYLREPTDAALLLRGIRLTREITRHPSLAAEIRSEVEPGAAVDDESALRRELRWRVATVYHPVGTCRMGSDERAVVDPELRVRGLSGLRIADASVMPALPSGNTNAASLMIGERAAEVIRSGASR